MGTFLVRSGILNSVHTFASDPARGTYILSFLSLMIFSLLIIFYKKFLSIFRINLQSKEFYILVNNWFMMYFLSTVFIGTVYPIFLDVISSQKISVGPPFYNIIIIPLVVPFLFLMAIGPQSKWIKHRYTNLYKFLLLFLVSIVMNFLIYFIFGSYSLLSNLIFISSIFLIIHSAIDTYQLVKKKVKFEYRKKRDIIINVACFFYRY